MATNWMTLDKFFEMENDYRGGRLNKENYDDICKKYDIVKCTKWWVGTKHVRSNLNMRNGKFHNDTPDISHFCDHYYSMKSKDGKTYWVLCPYYGGATKEEIKNLFKENFIKCEIYDGFYAGCTIVIKPEDMINACYDYYVASRKPGEWAVYKWSDTLSKSAKKVKSFTTKEEAQKLLDEINEKRRNFTGEW